MPPAARIVLPAEDGSVRVLCQGYEPGGDVAPVRAFAFDPNGRPRSGWPIDLSCCPDGLIVARVIGDVLTVNERELDPELVTSRVTTIAADGTIARGEPATYAHCCQELMAIGPDGVVYRVTPSDDINGEKSAELSAIGPAGLVTGFPVAIDGIVSPPAFDGAGRIHLTVGTPTADGLETGPARTLVLDAAGREVVGGSGNLGIVASDSCVPESKAPASGRRRRWSAGRHDIRDRRHLQRHDGRGHQSSGRGDGRLAVPSDDGSQSRGAAPRGDICEGYDLAIPALGPDNTLYLVHRSRAIPRRQQHRRRRHRWSRS